MSVSRLVSRTVASAKGRTSMRLEPELWSMLAEISDREAQTIDTLVRQIEAVGHDGGRTSAVRVFIIKYFHSAATEVGHATCGHGYIRHENQENESRSTRNSGSSDAALHATAG